MLPQPVSGGTQVCALVVVTQHPTLQVLPSQQGWPLAPHGMHEPLLRSQARPLATQNGAIEVSVE